MNGFKVSWIDYFITQDGQSFNTISTIQFEKEFLGDEDFCLYLATFNILFIAEYLYRWFKNKLPFRIKFQIFKPII